MKKLEYSATEDIAELKAFRDIGETFSYLGRTCVVTGYYKFYPIVGKVPALLFDYCDDHGVLHSTSIEVDLLPGIKKLQP
mgnify:CR=1 FL=1